MKKIHILFVCFMSCFSCQQNAGDQSTTGSVGTTDYVRGIDPPSAALMPTPHILSISNVERGGSFQLSDRVSIQIPENAFVDSSGKPVTGDVNLKYTEYFDAVDILLSGIPMEYDSAGKGEVLQSAGMFELNGSQKNHFIQIASGKTLMVNMNSTTPEADYNWYAFDKKNQKWGFLSSSVTEAKEEKKHSNKKVKETTHAGMSEETEPEKVTPGLYRKGEPVIDLEIDTRNFPELQSYNSLVWQYASEVSKEEQKRLEKIYSEKWEQIRIELKDERKNTFTLFLENGATKTQTTVVPVVDVKEYKRIADAAKTAQKNRELNAKAQSEEKLIAGLSQSTMRSFGVATFGLYNCDRIYRAEALVVQADFDVKDSDFVPKTIFVVNSASNTVYRYSWDQWDQVRLVPPDDQMIVAFMGDGKMAGLKPRQVKSILANKPSVQKFTLEVFPESELSVASLKNSAGI